MDYCCESCRLYSSETKCYALFISKIENRNCLLVTLEQTYYRLPGGSIDEGECKTKCINRECEEEIKLKISIDVNKCRKFILENKVPSLCYIITKENINIEELNKKINIDNLNISLPYYLREVSYCRWLDIETGKIIGETEENNKITKLVSLALNKLRKIHLD